MVHEVCEKSDWTFSEIESREAQIGLFDIGSGIGGVLGQLGYIPRVVDAARHHPLV
jgi:hypothetical protein